ncbi:metal-sulfur cluster assembly factor [Nocardioides sp. NPDC057577]|uniref:metal-sulfur cluster assembly factor n=1 Tax=Nocardioides sp. NPDC057577 TaxID=3346171 RepID=UPI00366E9C0F
MSLEEQVLDALRNVVDPCSVAAQTPFDIVDMGLVDGVATDDDGRVVVRLSLTTPSCMMLGQLTEQIDEHVGRVVGHVPRVQLDDGMTWTPERMSGRAQEVREARLRVLTLLPTPHAGS